MSFDPNYTKFPLPSYEFEGRNHVDQGNIPMDRAVRIWRPKGADDHDRAILARYAHRMVKIDGTAVTAEELVGGAVLHDRAQTLSDAAIQQAWENLGVNSYATLAAANTGEASDNIQFYNTTLKKVQMTTSDS